MAEDIARKYIIGRGDITEQAGFEASLVGRVNQTWAKKVAGNGAWKYIARVMQVVATLPSTETLTRRQDLMFSCRQNKPDVGEESGGECCEEIHSLQE